MEMEFILIEDESWMKLDLGGLVLPGFEGLSGDKYMHVDRSKIAEIEGLQIDADNVDPTGAELLVEAITDVKKTGEGTYSGTIDLSKTTDVGFVDEAIVTALGEQAKAVQFEAKLDAEGRLSELTAKVPAAGDVKAHELKITYFDYGSATPPQKPAASDVVEAPATLYEMFQE
jgi:hypothetical protein